MTPEAQRRKKKNNLLVSLHRRDSAVLRFWNWYFESVVTSRLRTYWVVLSAFCHTRLGLRGGKNNSTIFFVSASSTRRYSDGFMDCLVLSFYFESKVTSQLITYRSCRVVQFAMSNTRGSEEKKGKSTNFASACIVETRRLSDGIRTPSTIYLLPAYFNHINRISLRK